METGNTTVFLADDHAMVREGFAGLVEQQAGLSVVGQCGDGLEVQPKIDDLVPDVVVLDITMPGLNGLDVCRQLSEKYSHTAVLILSMHNDEQFIARALRYGASGYVVKDSAADQLIEAIHRVAAGELFLGPGIQPNVLQHVTGDDPYEQLTNRERQVLQMIVEGRSNREVAETLGLASKTVDTHRTRVMKKLNIHDRVELVKYALRHGTITLDSAKPS